MSHPLDHAEQEIIDAISEVMDKYSLRMKRTREYIDCDECYEFVCTTEYFELISTNSHTYMNNILEKLLPINYGKVKK